MITIWCLMFVVVVTTRHVIHGFSPLRLNSADVVARHNRPPNSGWVTVFKSQPFGTRLRLGVNDEGKSYNGEQDRIKKGLSSLYPSNELQDILSLHENFLASQVEEEENPNKKKTAASLHDLIVGMVEGEANKKEFKANKANSKTPRMKPRPQNLPTALVEKLPRIRVVASDVDGTILSASHPGIHTVTQNAILKALSYSANDNDNNNDNVLDAYFFATGKSRKGAFQSVGPKLTSNLNPTALPGVYLNGLYCTGINGTVVLERKLPTTTVAAAERLAQEHGMAVVAYDGDDLYASAQDIEKEVVRELGGKYKETMPRVIPPNDGHSPDTNVSRTLSSYQPGFHKLLLMHANTTLLQTTFRPLVNTLASNYNASATQSLPTMLELLPKGASKGKGVAAVCASMGVHPQEQLLALGDAENDVEMLSMAAIGVCMGNGSPIAKEVADWVMQETCVDGGAGLAMEWFAFEPNEETQVEV